ncbi:hypothetical protein JOC34_000490 [Virgibacillus halotolerans]|uniref:hypothetical protein n=1 Tax=Virgibacillus halotolerans TaxID=1071053 RepID=UPI00195FCCE5|nr:hypothetical protein [Virgibacillus halotolerans]MBM7598133.1 hypothetical protein [Virgibacillus halotolerans]
MIMAQSQLTNLVDSLKYGHGNIISKNENYAITKPLNTWDTNYRLYDKKEGLTYLIDCEDVQENEEHLNEYGGILFQSLINLEIEEIKSISWKTEKDNFY